MKRVLVVGGAGYIGGWLTDRLIEAGYETRVYDLLLYEERFLKDVEFIAGDVLDHERLRPHLDWAEAVVWLAALVGDPACALNPGVTQKINVDTINWLCQTFEGRIVFPSTCSVYGANDQEVDENSATDPLSLYAQGKLEAEGVIMAKRPDSLIFRLATIAGVGDSYSRIRMDLVVNLLVMRAKLVGQLQVFGGAQYRPILHVRDVATAIVPQIGGRASGIFNLGAENDTIAAYCRAGRRARGRRRNLCRSTFPFKTHGTIGSPLIARPPSSDSSPNTRWRMPSIRSRGSSTTVGSRT